MFNDPELQQKSKYLGSISKDFVQVCDSLKEAAYLMQKRGISQFPIFPVAKQNIAVGQLIIPNQDKREWIFYISLLEEFTQRGLVAPDNEAQFKQIYKNPDEYCCLFVVDEDFLNFLFIPYPDDDEKSNLLIDN